MKDKLTIDEIERIKELVIKFHDIILNSETKESNEEIAETIEEVIKEQGFFCVQDVIDKFKEKGKTKDKTSIQRMIDRFNE